MSLPRPTGLKPPSKIGKPTGLPQPRSSGTGIPTPSSTSKAQSAIAKSARAAGLSSNLAEKYAADVVQQLPVKRGPDLPPPPPADDFIVGDRVWVSGTKPGFIAYIGETQFATGDWAGVVLDKPEGKNDGSVQGVRYFQCEPKRGVFSRITKLSRTPGIVSATPNPDGASEGVPANVRTTNGNSNMSQTLPHARPTTPKLSMSRTLSSSSSSLHKASPTAPSQNIVPKSTSSGVGKQLKIGDRVLVSGTKTGTLRYMGATDFAKGDWAGVELDEKQGKNDGAVAGKRYFDCKPMYGLFAPVHKVTKLASGNAGHVMSASTPSPQTRSLVNTGLRLSRERSGSQESVSSISSTASSVSRSRLPLRQKRRLQLDTPVAKNRPSTLNLTATTQALQKALKEKEEHIEQLLRERDLERAEVARAAAQVDEAEGQLTSMKQEQMRQRDESEENVTKLRAFIQSLEQEKADILCKLEDEKRKVEDLQFQIEEEAITKDDLESRTEEEEAKLRNLERDLKKEKERADKYEQEFYTVKAMLKDNKEALASTEEMNMSYLDQIEELTHKLSQAESTVKNYEATRLEEGAKNSQVSIELVEKSNRIIELEDILSNRNKEVKDLHHRIHEVEDELKSSKNKKNKMQETIENLNSQLAHRDEASNNLTSEIQNLKSQLSDLQRRLDASNHNNEQLQDEKRQIEQQMSEMMKNSGDSSQKLSMLNDQVQEKNRKIQDLQAALSNSTQQLGKLNDEIENLKQATLRERENLVLKNEEISKTYQGQLEDLQVELDKANTKMQQMNESHKKEKDDSLGRKIREIEELKKQLQQSIEEQEKQEVQTQAHKQVLEKITMEKEALQFEKEKGEKLTKRLESEKESLNAELVHAKAEVSKVQEECQKVNAESKQLQEQMQDVKSDLEKMTKSKNEIQNQVSSIETERDKATEERDNLRREGMESKVTLQQKDMLIGELQKEVEKMKSEVQNSQETIMQMSHEESSLQELQSQLNESSRQYEELQKSMHEVESERDTMRAQLQFSNLVAEEKRRLEDQNQQLSIEAERTELRFRKEIETLEGSNSTLRDELGDVKEQLLGKDREVESFKQQVANLKNENISLESYRMSVQKMEKERGEFQEKISRLEASLSEAKTISPNMNSIAASDNSAVGPLQEEKTALQGQVDFLNSVIVDLQQKNKDLTHKMEVLESGIITNGDHDSSLETDLPKSRAPPRLFCDICDVFDQHDTDDCPLQAMDYDDDDTPSPSHHHGDRKASRPYCDICEEFHVPCSTADTSLPTIVLTEPKQQQSLWHEPAVRYHSNSETVAFEKGNESAVYNDKQNCTNDPDIPEEDESRDDNMKTEEFFSQNVTKDRRSEENDESILIQNFKLTENCDVNKEEEYMTSIAQDSKFLKYYDISEENYETNPLQNSEFDEKSVNGKKEDSLTNAFEACDVMKEECNMINAFEDCDVNKQNRHTRNADQDAVVIEGRDLSKGDDDYLDEMEDVAYEMDQRINNNDDDDDNDDDYDDDDDDDDDDAKKDICDEKDEDSYEEETSRTQEDDDLAMSTVNRRSVREGKSMDASHRDSGIGSDHADMVSPDRDCLSQEDPGSQSGMINPDTDCLCEEDLGNQSVGIQVSTDGTPVRCNVMSRDDNSPPEDTAIEKDIPHCMVGNVASSSVDGDDGLGVVGPDNLTEESTDGGGSSVDGLEVPDKPKMEDSCRVS